MQSYRSAEALRHPKNWRCASQKLALCQREDEFISSQRRYGKNSGLQVGQHFSKGGRA